MYASPHAYRCHLAHCSLTRTPPGSMQAQAKEEGTVTYVSNMWDTYFEGGRDHRLDRLSITQLPYYDGAPRGPGGGAAQGWARTPGLGAARRACSAGRNPRARTGRQAWRGWGTSARCGSRCVPVCPPWIGCAPPLPCRRLLARRSGKPAGEHLQRGAGRQGRSAPKDHLLLSKQAAQEPARGARHREHARGAAAPAGGDHPGAMRGLCCAPRGAL